MHIPDNYLSPATCAIMGAVMIPVWTRAVNKVKKEVTKKKMPLMGIGASLSFLVMMFNIPLPGGTSGHAIGGTLIAIILGPEAACISITIALLIQALLFGDGGVLAFSVNSFNMAFVLPFVGYYIYKFLNERVNTEKGEYISAFVGSYIAINIAALCAAIEFGFQPLLFKDATGAAMYCPYPLGITIPAMLIPHLFAAGVLEAIITVGVLRFIKKVSPETIYENSKIGGKPIYAFIIALICLSPLGLIASGTAWGEWSAKDISSIATRGKVLGFVPKGMQNGFEFPSLMKNYTLQGLPHILAYILSAVAGASLLIIIFRLIASVKKNTNNANN